MDTDAVDVDAVLPIAVIVAYGYLIVLSLWAMRVQRAAAVVQHHPHDHSAVTHVVERTAHGIIAGVLIASLVVRLVQLTFDITLWLLVPLTILVALPTVSVTRDVWRMGMEDMHNWYISWPNKLKTLVLLGCSAAIVADQVWRVVTLFWF
jgi:uncharacterized protein YacL